jgi:hypothetical protein
MLETACRTSTGSVPVPRIRAGGAPRCSHTYGKLHCCPGWPSHLPRRISRDEDRRPSPDSNGAGTRASQVSWGAALRRAGRSPVPKQQVVGGATPHFSLSTVQFTTALPLTCARARPRGGSTRGNHTLRLSTRADSTSSTDAPNVLPTLAVATMNVTVHRPR